MCAGSFLDAVRVDLRSRNRAAEIYAEHKFLIFRRTDRLFAILLPAQWIAFVLAALFSSAIPSGNPSSSLQTIILLGGLSTILPLIFIFFRPGNVLTGCVVATCQIVISSLFMHFTGGKVEAHIHTFASLAILSLYRDWRVLIPATFVAAINHWIYISPSFIVFDFNNVRIEDFGWIILENIFLFESCRRNQREMLSIAERTAELEFREERYRAVVEQTEEGIVLIEPQSMRVIECNQAFSNLLGCKSIEETKTLTAFDFNTDGKWEVEYLTDTFGNKKAAFSGEKNYRRRDGTIFPVEVNVKLINYSGTRVFCVSTKDITERKKTEAELLRFALVLQKTQNAVILTNSDGIIEWVNEGFTSLTGYQPEEVIGLLGYILQGEKTCPTTVETIRTTMWARKPYIGEIYGYTKEGRGMWMSVSITPILLADGEAQGFIAVHQEITERKQMENALRSAHDQLEHRVAERTAELVRANRSLQIEVNERKKAQAELDQVQQFLRAVIDNVPNMIFVKDAECRYTLVNFAKAQLYDTTIDDLIGKTDADFYQDEERIERIRRVDQNVLENLQEEVFYEDKFVAPNGKTSWLQVVKKPLFIGNDKERYLLGIATDLTELKELEAKLNHSRKLQSIGQLAAGIAHEINTPTQYVGDNTRFLQSAFSDITKVLNAYERLVDAVRQNSFNSEILAEVESEIEQCEMNYLTDEIPKALENALEGVSRIGKIIKSMRTFSHPGKIEKIKADLNRAIENTIAVAHNEWKYIADLETDFDANLPPVPCLLDEINQVILNMIVNAAHAITDAVGDDSGVKGKISVSTINIADEWAEVRISDSGTGIPVEVQSRIFDPFFTTKEVGRGTGQGLAISHSVVVEKHGGQIDFHTSPENGTTFIIRLPLNQN